jgi:hypothetical protein
MGGEDWLCDGKTRDLMVCDTWLILLNTHEHRQRPCSSESHRKTCRESVNTSKSFRFIFLFASYQYFSAGVGLEHAKHIQLESVPLSVKPSDIRRAITRAGLQGVSDGMCKGNLTFYN